MAISENPVVKKLVETGEAQVGKVVQQVLSNERFVTTVQSVVQTTLAAKGTFDRSIQAALGAMNLPSVQDLEAVKGKVADLEGTLAKLDEKISALLEAQQAADKKKK